MKQFQIEFEKWLIDADTETEAIVKLVERLNKTMPALKKISASLTTTNNYSVENTINEDQEDG